MYVGYVVWTRKWFRDAETMQRWIERNRYRFQIVRHTALSVEYRKLVQIRNPR
jgi:hypothetical protein